jgi:hypothetical protein
MAAAGFTLTMVKADPDRPWIYCRHRSQETGKRRTRSMADTQAGAMAPGDGGDEPIPFLQQVLDNPFVLLFLGVTFPTVFYIIWGVMEVTSIPIAN